MIKKIGFIFICLVLVAFSGCNKKIIGNNEFFYNPYTQKMIKYNSELKNAELWSSTRNQFQYAVGNENIYVDGNSYSNEFSLIKLEKSSITKIYEFPKNEGFFPIGEKNGKIYFIHSYYQENGNEDYEKRKLSVFDLSTKEIQEFSNTSGLIDYGIVGEKYIYYTIYDNEKDIYSLMKIKNTDTNQIPEVIKTTLNDGLLLLENDELYYSDGNKLISNNKEYKKESVNVFYGTLLFQYYLNQDSQLCVRVTNTINNAVFVEENIIGIRIENNKVIICKMGQVVTHDL